MSDNKNISHADKFEHVLAAYLLGEKEFIQYCKKHEINVSNVLKWQFEIIRTFSKD